MMSKNLLRVNKANPFRTNPTAQLLLLVSTLIGLISFNAVAATFEQTNWGMGTPQNSTDCLSVGGVWTGSLCTANDPTDQSGWAAYDTKETNLAIVGAGTDLQLVAPADSITHTTQADLKFNTNTFRTQAGASDFATGTASNLVVGTAIRLDMLSTSPLWSVNTAWNSSDVGSYAIPVFSDLDNDGDFDLIVGLSQGRVYAYQNIGTDAVPTWAYTPAWNGFDVGSYASPSLADLDNDGDVDLLVGESLGNTLAYENIGDNNAPIWSANASWDAPNIGNYARPRLLDLDDDGDYDLLQGSQSGLVYAYENTGSVNMPIWTAKPAWNLPDAGSFSIPEGGDLDKDGDIDILVGDLSGATYAYENTGTNTAPVWTANPAWNTIDIGASAAPSLADIDADGDLDAFIGSNLGVPMAYENIGTQYASPGNFESSVVDTGLHGGLTTLSFNALLPTNTAIIMAVRSGNTATPDGTWTVWQTDLISGDDISIQGDNRYVQYRAQLSSSDGSATPTLLSTSINFTNTPDGTSVTVDDGNIRLSYLSASPAWSVASSWDTVDLSYRPIPRLVDMDDDGDLDMMVGISTGFILGMENTGTTNAPIWVSKPAWNTTMDIGSSAAADFADLDNDGDYDMILANSNGNTYGYENSGNKNIPIWTEKPEWHLGNISFDRVPTLADLDNDGDFDLLFGDYRGISYGYRNIGTITSPSWVYHSDWNAPDVGSDSSPAFADLDGDGDFDVLIGGLSGVVRGYENTGDKRNPIWTYNAAWEIADMGNTSAPALGRLDSDWDYDLVIGEINGLNFGYQNTGLTTFNSSGIYFSSAIDFGSHAGFTVLDYIANLPAGTSLSVDVRSGATSAPNDSWSAWQNDIGNGGDISTLPRNRYMQYRVNLTTTDTSTTPSVSAVTINYLRYAPSASLTSSAFNTNQIGSILNTLSWNEILPSNTDVQIQLRSAADDSSAPAPWSNWFGPDGTSASFWSSANSHSGGCSGSGIITCNQLPAQLRNTLTGQWFQYQITFTSDGILTPTLSNLAVEYIEANNVGSGQVNVSAISGATSEWGATATFTVVLNSAPMANVTMALYSTDTTEGLVSPSALSFTPSDWDTAQTITVTGLDDVQDDGDINYTIITGAVSSTDTNYDDINPSDVIVSNVDNDAAGVTVAPSAGLVTDESGQTASFSLALTSQPSANVSIGLQSSNINEGTVSPASLTFTPSNWSVLQTAVVTGIDDAVIDNSVAYTVITAPVISADSGYSGFNPLDISLTNADNDISDIRVESAYEFITNESGGFVPFTIMLTSVPTANVTFMLSSSDNSEGRVSPFTMTFTPSNWNKPKLGSILGVSDSIVDGDQDYVIVTSNFISGDANYHGVNPSDIPATNVDTNSYNVTVSPISAPMMTTEDGGTAAFSVHLSLPPTADVTFTFTSTDPDEGIPTPSSITFSPSNEAWRGQVVTVTGVDDRVIDNDQPYTVIVDLVSSDSNYSAIDPADISLINKDSNRNTAQHLQNDIGGSMYGTRVISADVNCDAIPDLLVSTSGQVYDEVYAYHGSTNGYTNTPDWIGRDTVVDTAFGLGLANVGDINNDGCDDIMIGAPLTEFTRGSAYLFLGSANGLADADDDGIGRPSDAVWQVADTQNSAELGASFTAGDFNGDSFIDVAIAAVSYHGGSNNEGRIYVFLNSASGLPDADADGIALISEAAWMFESGGPSGFAGEHQGLATANVNGDAYDDLVIAAAGMSRAYAFYGSAALFNDAGNDGLADPSDADWAVTNNVSGSDLSSVANAGDLNGDGVDDLLVGAYLYTNGEVQEGTAYVFYGSNPNGLPDADLDKLAQPSDAAWQVEPNDRWAKMGRWVSPAGDFNNDGFQDVMAGAYGYSLVDDRHGGVFIYPGSSGGLSTTPVWFQTGKHPGDYFGSVVGLLGDINNDGYSDIYVSASQFGSPFSGAGDKYNEGGVFVFISHIQTAGYTVTPTGTFSTTESGGQASFNIALDAPPYVDVSFVVNSNDMTEGTVSPTSLSFDQNNWMTSQTITVTGVNDAVMDADASYQVSIAINTSTDSDYAVLAATTLNMTNIDNDIPPQVSVAVTSSGEAGNGSVTFSHSGEINNPLTLNYTITGTATADSDYASLSGVAIIPSGSASITRPINIIDDARHEPTETIIFTIAPGLDYTSGTPASATSNITDNDTVGAVTWPLSGLVTTEAGGTDNFSIRLTSEPSASVTINLSSSDLGEALAMPSSVTFTPSNWQIDQFISVVGQDDGILDGDIAFAITTSAIFSSDPDYTGLALPDVTGTNRDDDPLPTVTLTSSVATINEGTSLNEAFTISRSGSTAVALRVFYNTAGSATSAIDFVPLAGNNIILAGESSLSITLATLQDSLVEGNEAIEVTLLAASDYLVAQPATTTLTIIDDDDPLTLPQANFTLDQTVGEGVSVTVTAILTKAAHIYPVTLPFTVSGTATNPDDHNAVNGNIVIASGLHGSTTFNAIDDGTTGEIDETVIFTMASPNNARLGSRTSHTVTLTENNAPAKVTLIAQQNAADARLVVTGDGNVTVTASVDDPNPGDNHNFDWSLSNNSLVDINDGNPATFVFDPSGLLASFNKIRLTVTDTGTPAQSVSVELLLQVVTTAPTLSAIDTDNDGISDDTESFIDSDGDGLADYLDSTHFAPNELQLDLVNNVSYILRTEPGLLLGLGNVAFAAGADGAHVTTDDISSYGGGEGDAGTASALDTVASPSGYFDFVISGLPEAGQSVKIVIPQLVAIPGSAAYRKYDPLSGWRDFAIDTKNTLSSAAGSPGVCPLPGDSAYTAGLSAGHYCIQLKIEDGGPNDTDGETNNIIEDPGNIIKDQRSPHSGTGDSVETSPKGGGGLLNLMLLIALFIVQRRRLWRVVYKRTPRD